MTLTLKTVNQFFCTTHGLMIVHHHTKFGPKWLYSSGDTKRTQLDIQTELKTDKRMEWIQYTQYISNIKKNLLQMCPYFLLYVSSNKTKDKTANISVLQLIGQPLSPQVPCFSATNHRHQPCLASSTPHPPQLGHWCGRCSTRRSAIEQGSRQDMKVQHMYSRGS